MNKGTTLINKRTGRQVVVIESYSTISKKTDWKTETCYRCKNRGKKGWTLIQERELRKWSKEDE